MKKKDNLDKRKWRCAGFSKVKSLELAQHLTEKGVYSSIDEAHYQPTEYDKAKAVKRQKLFKANPHNSPRRWRKTKLSSRQPA